MKTSASWYVTLRFYGFLNFPKIETFVFFWKVKEFVAILGMQYLMNELKWVIETSQAEFISDVDEQELKAKI